MENSEFGGNNEKLKALQAAMDKIEKNYGKGSIMKLGDEHVQEVEVIPTGSIGLNAALGVGGYPKGRIIEIYGPESSGKTTLAIHAIAEAQKDGWHRSLHRRGTCFRPFLCGQAGSRHRQSLDFPQPGQRRASIGNRRPTHPLVGHRHHRHRLCGRTDPKAELEERHGRQ